MGHSPKNTGDALGSLVSQYSYRSHFGCRRPCSRTQGARQRAAAGAFAVSIAVVLGMTARLGSSPEDSWSDQTWLGSIGAVRLRLAVLAEVALPPEPPSKSESRDDEFLLRRLLAGEDPDSPGKGSHRFRKRASRGKLSMSTRLDSHTARVCIEFSAWTEEKSSAAVLDVSTTDSWGRARTGPGRVGLRGTRALAENGRRVPRIRRCLQTIGKPRPPSPADQWTMGISGAQAVEKPILVDTGEVRVTGESPAATEVVDES